MRELNLHEVQSISGGLTELALLALTGTAIVGSGLSAIGITYTLTANGAGSSALGAGMVLAAIGSWWNFGVGMYLGSMILAGYISSEYKESAFFHGCGA